jgi:hypothetical protein
MGYKSKVCQLLNPIGSLISQQPTWKSLFAQGRIGNVLEINVLEHAIPNDKEDRIRGAHSSQTGVAD